MSDEAVVVSGFVNFWYNLLQSQWSTVLGVIIAYCLYHFAKVSLNIVLFLVFAAVAISLLTGVGVIPQLDELVAWIKGVVGNVGV